MTTIKQQMRSDLTDAMRAKDKETLATLRLLLTAVSAEEVSGKTARELSDDDVITVLTRERKRRLEAAAAFEEGGRADRAAAERSEAGIIERYLPQQLSQSELAELVEAAVAEAAAAGLTGGRAMGAVMKNLRPATAGRADGAQVAAMVKQALGMS